MKKGKVKKLWNELSQMENKDEALSIWYSVLPQKVLKKIETPCWGKEVVEDHYNIVLD